MSKPKIGIFSIALLYIASIGIFNHLIIMPAILEVAGRDAWVAILCTGVLYMLWLIPIAGVLKQKNDVPVLKRIEQGVGKPITILIRLLYAINLLITTYIAIKDTVTWTRLSYLVETPALVILLLILIVCFASAALGLETIVITNGVLLPLVIFLGLFVMLGNLPKKDYSLLLPVYQNGIQPILQGMFYSSIGLVEIVSLLFIQHRMKEPMKYSQIVILGLILVMLTLGVSMGALAIFGPETASEQRYPAYEQWRVLSLGGYVEHIDFLSMYQWLTGSVIRISYGIWLLSEIIGIGELRRKNWWIAGLTLVVAILCIFPESDIQFWKMTETYLTPISFGLLFIVTVMTLLCLWISRRKMANRKGVRTG
ncbi:GerAB/ArcD/ProY family transporter [Marininema halotolerans]|uniref:GerAB/ArcD/ProY family transporter n=1 Tax=Marininema halotolerans TaxID=1155944 RepID=UPI0015961B64|nr:endospore germination permease [Marininema halotolerans]